MNSFKIKVSMVNDVNSFVSVCNKFEDDIVIRSGRFIINAKSLMGVYSLDLAKPIDVTIETEDKDAIEKFKQAIACYMV